MNIFRETIIRNYVDAYNFFDVERMIRDMDENIRFRNIQGAEVNLTLDGIADFKRQAEQAKTFFKSRHQQILSFKHMEDATEIAIRYSAVLGIDFPNGLKKGQKLELNGRSVFKFEHDKIVELTDIS